MISSKINITRIFVDHIKSLRSETGNHGKEIVTFFLIPFLISIWWFLDRGTRFSMDSDILLIVLSIFTGLLFNINILLINFAKNEVNLKFRNAVEERKRALSETFTNISFEILLAIIIILIILGIKAFSGILLHLATSLVVFLMCNYVLTLLMILKRIKVLFDYEIRLISQNDDTSRSKRSA